MAQNSLVENEQRLQRKVQSLEMELKIITDDYAKKCMKIEKIKDNEKLRHEAELS